MKPGKQMTLSGHVKYLRVTSKVIFYKEILTKHLINMFHFT